MTGLRREQLEGIYSGGTVRDSHTVHYSSSPRQDVAADTAGIYMVSSILQNHIFNVNSKLSTSSHIVFFVPLFSIKKRKTYFAARQAGFNQMYPACPGNYLCLSSNQG